MGLVPFLHRLPLQEAKLLNAVQAASKTAGTKGAQGKKHEPLPASAAREPSPQEQAAQKQPLQPKQKRQKQLPKQ
mgnify:CR=1 FL=1